MVTYVKTAFVTEALSYFHLETSVFTQFYQWTKIPDQTTFAAYICFSCQKLPPLPLFLQTVNMLDTFCHVQKTVSNIIPHNSLLRTRLRESDERVCIKLQVINHVRKLFSVMWSKRQLCHNAYSRHFLMHFITCLH